MKEVWKDIQDYEGFYQVSNLGRIKSLGNSKTRKEKILKPIYHKQYYQITLSKNNIRIQYRVHRLVAEAFIPNPDNLPQVNHKDENKLNNYVDNLEWCDALYNNNYKDKGKRISKTKTGHTVSQETRNKISETLKKYFKENNRKPLGE